MKKIMAVMAVVPMIALGATALAHDRQSYDNPLAEDLHANCVACCVYRSSQVRHQWGRHISLEHCDEACGSFVERVLKLVDG